MNENTFDKNHPEYVPFSNAYIGHLMIGGISTTLAAVIFWLISPIFIAHGVDLTTFTTFVFILILVSELCITLIQRPFVVRGQKGAPGGWGYALPELLVTPILGFVGFIAISHEIYASVFFGTVLLVCTGLLFLYLKPWEPGITRREVREKFEQTKAMVPEDTLAEKYKGVEKNPDHEKLFHRKNLRN